MIPRKILIPVLAVVTIVAVAVVVYFTMNPVVTTYEFQVRDAVSKDWVWDAAFRLQNRVIRAYYQSDRGPVPYIFTSLEPGVGELEISAPSYMPQKIPVSLKHGENRLKEPIDLVGYEIPDLTRWIIFEERVGNNIVQEIRPVSSEGIAVFNHPCLDLWISARVAVQIYDGLPVQDKTEWGSEHGKELYKGILEWEWDALPETIFRYSSFIPGSRIKANSDPYWVIDYLIIVPDPRKISSEELEEIMKKTMDLSPEAIEDYLEPYEREGKFTPYIVTSWNVEGGSS